MSKKIKKSKKNNPQASHKVSGNKNRNTGYSKPDILHESGENLWLYGRHAVQAALCNPKRTVVRLLATSDSFLQYDIQCTFQSSPEKASRAQISEIIGDEAVHQNIAALCAPLPQPHIEELLSALENRTTARLLVLDQVTDPQNIGAILRSAAAFDCAGILVPDRHSSPVTSALAKAACGALETVPFVRVTNLKRALEKLKNAGFWTIGLDGTAQTSLSEARTDGKSALVMGSEGKGLRRLTREHCDMLVKLPMSDAMESLNVSVAAAIGLYELYRK